MPCEIVVEEVDRLIHVRYSGEVTLEERLAIARKVLDDVERTGIHGLLLDFRDAQSLGKDPADCTRMADHCTPRLPQDARLAYLLRYDHQLDESLETLMRSRGVQVERFHDAATATAWLQGAEPADPVGAGAPPQPELHRAFRLVGEVVDPATPVSPDQFAAIGELVQELLAQGVDEPTVRQLAGRMWSVMRPQPRD